MIKFLGIVAALAVGLLVEFWADEILGARVATSFQEVAWLPTLFWLSLGATLLFNILDLVATRSKDAAHARALEELQAASVLGPNHRSAMDLVEKSIDKLNGVELRKDLALPIRFYLRAFASLATIHDGDRSESYAANIAYFVKRTSLRVRFSHLEPEQLDGFLVLDRRLSASVKRALPCERLEEFAFPVPKETRNKRGRLQVLPGAPRAFRESYRMELYSKTVNIVRYCKRQGAFSKGVVRELREYVGRDEPPFGSFVSIPLRLSAGGKPIAVLNIQSDGENILSVGANHFAKLIEVDTIKMTRHLAEFLKQERLNNDTET